MKKITLYIALLLCCTSCEKYLKVSPSNILALKSYDDVKTLMGSHLKMYTVAGEGTHKLTGTAIPWRYRGIQSDIHLFWGFYSDDLDTDTWFNPGNFAANNKRILYTNSINWQNATMPGIIWSLYYNNIGFYNTIIDELENVSGSQQDKDIVGQEARVLRVWNLFKILQYFSPYENNELGIPYNTASQAVGSYNKKRKTQTQVYEFLIKELNSVLECATEPRSSYNIFYNKKIVHALLAEIYLFKGGSGAKAEDDYNQAILHAKAAMEGRSLQTIDTYQPVPLFANNTAAGLYKDKQQALIVDVALISDNGMYSTFSRANQKEFARQELIDLYSPNDIRKTMFFGADRTIRKYEELYKKINGLGVYNFFSIAEMHLIVAESYARKGQTSEAKNWLEIFQKQRIKDYAGFTGTDVLAEIMNERRKEFCFEQDMRWCDLIRTRKGWSRNSYYDDKKPVYILENNDFRFCLPIPLEELSNNNQIQQNPGWGLL